MRRKEKLPELLAPAGDFDALVAAVNAGADAVYVGGKAFGARAYAKNFDTEELRRAVVYCHLHGAKLYLTMNILLNEDEIKAALDFAAIAYATGVDALIVADVGLVRALRRALPDMELHASTQMSVHNTLGADMAYGLGCKRVVVARELCESDIRSVVDNSLAEVEMFVHGALCVSYSGQCLFSSMVGGRSGNRGECAQPCRLPYGKGYPLSLTDLSLADHIESVIDSGVASLKIEGRMKSPEYVYTVTGIYRKLLDEHRSATPDEKRRLAQAFSRGGFTDGYYMKKTSKKDMLGVRSEEDKRDSRDIGEVDYTHTRVEISAKAEFLLGQKCKLILTNKVTGRSVTAYGDRVEAARNAPLGRDSVIARLCKMGQTFFSLDESDVAVVIDEGVNLSPGQINALRRSAVAMLESVGYEREPVAIDTENALVEDHRIPDGEPLRTALFLRSEVYSRVSRSALDYFDVCFLPLMDSVELTSSSVGVYLPPVITDGELEGVRRALDNARASGVKYALVGNLGHIPLAKEYGLTPVGDIRLNITNPLARAAYLELGVSRAVLSVELTAGQARGVGGSVLVCGRIPLMLTERCFMAENGGCSRCSRISLTDRRGMSFPMMREYPHRNIILNSALTYMGDRESELDSPRLTGRHFVFSVESPSEVESLISAYRRGEKMPLSVPFRRMGRRENTKK